MDMSLKKYTMKFKIEKIYKVDVETEHDPFTDEGSEELSNMVLEDYENGEMEHEEEMDCTFSTYDYEEIK